MSVDRGPPPPTVRSQDDTLAGLEREAAQTVLLEQMQREMDALHRTAAGGHSGGYAVPQNNNQYETHEHHQQLQQQQHQQGDMSRPLFSQEGLVYDLLRNAQESAARLKVELDNARVQKEVTVQECLQLKQQNRRLLDDQEQLTLARRDLEGKLQFRMNQILSLEQERSKTSLKETELTERLSILERQNNSLRGDLVASNTELRVAMARNSSLEQRLQEQTKAASDDTVPLAVYRTAQEELEKQRVEAAAHAKSLQTHLDEVRRRYGELSEKRVKDLEFSNEHHSRENNSNKRNTVESHAPNLAKHTPTSPPKSAATLPSAMAAAAAAAAAAEATAAADAVSTQHAALAEKRRASLGLASDSAKAGSTPHAPSSPKQPTVNANPSASPPQSVNVGGVSGPANGRYQATKEVLTSSDEEDGVGTKRWTVTGDANSITSTVEQKRFAPPGARERAASSSTAAAGTRTTSAMSAFALARRTSSAASSSAGKSSATPAAIGAVPRKPSVAGGPAAIPTVVRRGTTPVTTNNGRTTLTEGPRPAAAAPVRRATAAPAPAAKTAVPSARGAPLPSSRQPPTTTRRKNAL